MNQHAEEYRHTLRLIFPPIDSGRPLMCELAKKHGFTFNIIAGRTIPGSTGSLTVEVWGSARNCEAALRELHSQGVTVDEVSPRASRQYRRILRLSFPPENSGHPIMNSLALGYGVTVNILGGAITPRKEGYLTMEMSGDWSDCEDAIRFLQGQNIVVTEARKQISHDDALCMDCGMCLSMCPTGALGISREDRKLVFDNEKCIACRKCTLVCPVRAMVWQPLGNETDNGAMNGDHEKAS